MENDRRVHGQNNQMTADFGEKHQAIQPVRFSPENEGKNTDMAEPDRNAEK